VLNDENDIEDQGDTPPCEGARVSVVDVLSAACLQSLFLGEVVDGANNDRNLGDAPFLKREGKKD
jgi:hypothetical protein